MIKTTRADSLIGIVIGVFILSFALLGIINILNYNKTVSQTFEENIYNYLIDTSGDNIIKKLDTNNVSYNQDFYIYKDEINKEFVIYPGSETGSYAYIDKLGNSVDKDTNLGKTYKRIFNNQTDVLKHSIYPNEISNLVLHFDATNINGLNNSTINNLDQISNWTDLSGNNNNGIQSNPTKRPIFTSTGIYINPFLEFDGSKTLNIDNDGTLNDDNDSLTNITYNEKSFGIVFKTGFDVNSYQTLYEQGDSTKGYAIQINNGGIYAGVWNSSWDSGNQYKYVNIGEIIPDTIYFIILTQESKSTDDNLNKLKIYLNGELSGEVNHVDAQTEHSGLIGLGSIFHNSYDLYNNIPISSSDNVSYFEGGGIGEFIIWNHSLSKNEVRGINNYFLTKWLNQDEHIIYNVITNKTIKYNY